jgi:hypothetical protein
MPIDRSRRFARVSSIWTVILGTGGTVLGAILGGAGLAWGVALGALAGGLNLAAMADEIAWMLQQTSGEEPPAGARKRPFTRLRWPLFLLALAGILWYTPARPEGVAGGILLVLAAAVIAGLPRARPHEPEPD